MGITVTRGQLSKLDLVASGMGQRKESKSPETSLQTEDDSHEHSTVSELSVIRAIEKANKINLDHNTKAEFTVHETTKDIMVRIIDVESKEVIREFPPKKILDLIAKLWDLAGIVVDERR